MRRVCMFALVFAVIAGVTAPAWAEALAPIAVKGWNRDVLFGGTATSGGYAVGQDSGTNGFYVNGAMVNSVPWQPGYGLPLGTFSSLTDATHLYCMQYAGDETASNNVLYMTSSTTATVTATLVQNGYYDQIGVLAISGNGNANAKQIVLHYDDGSTGSGSFYAYDWTGWNNPTRAGYTQIAVNNFYRATSATGGSNTFTGSGDGSPWDKAMFESLITVDSTKLLDSITFSQTAASYCSIFAISGGPVPEPTTLALSISGLIGLLCYAWRKRK